MAVVGRGHYGDMSAVVHLPLSSTTGVATTAGRGGHDNDDAWLIGPDWWLIADGIGGHAGAGCASAVVVSAFRDRAAPLDESQISDAVLDAHRSVIAAATPMTAGMGATVVGLALIGEDVVVFHVGDGRAYAVKDGRCERITVDHTPVQEMIELGMISPAQAARHPYRHLVSRALGTELESTPTLCRRPAHGRVVLCSDGVSRALDESEIARVVVDDAHPQVIADHLIARVLEGPAPDDATAVVVDLGSSALVQRPGRYKP